VQVHGDAWCDGTHLVTNGPFNLEAWQPGQSLVLARNPAYRGRFDGNVERLRLSLFPSGAWSEALTLYERDQLDAMPISGFPTPELEAARQRHDRDYVSSPQFETYVAGFDVSQPPFDDVRVRRALAQAIDRELLADVILRGHVSPATGGFVPPGMPGHSAGIGLPHDPNRARKLLTEAGFPGGRGLPVVEAILSGFSAASICPFLVAQWHEKLGVGCTCQQMDLDAAIERTYREPPHIVGVGFTADYPDPYSFLKAAVSHTRTFTHWKNETYDRLVDEAGQPRNQEQRMHLYRQAEEILLADVGIIPLVYGRSHMLVKPWIRNYFGSRAGTPFWKDVIIEPH
jgi:oligopeptide transport system substrate-binding protein